MGIMRQLDIVRKIHSARYTSRFKNVVVSGGRSTEFAEVLQTSKFT